MGKIRKSHKIVRDDIWRKVNRASALVDQDGRCKYCLSRLSYRTSTADHVIPRSKHGADNRRNIVACCEKCNITKGSMSVKQFKKLIRNPPRGHHKSIYFLLANMRLRLNKRTDKACKNIKAACR